MGHVDVYERHVALNLVIRDSPEKTRLRQSASSTLPVLVMPWSLKRSMVSVLKTLPIFAGKRGRTHHYRTMTCKKIVSYGF